MWAIVFNGKIETERPDEVLGKFNEILNSTDSDFIGRIERYQFAEYIDCQKVEPVDVKDDDPEVEGN